ncbi:MAG: VWA domain-containing protein [Spirochaetaceae bacterium]|nr:VWA domain-containing protein [Spirochaetaceae bacterium]
MKRVLILAGLMAAVNLVANPLQIGAGETRIFANRDGSFELFVLAVPGRASILLTDSSVDESQLADSYALRSYDEHISLVGERRILDGVYIDNTDRIARGLEPVFFLMSSRPLAVPFFNDEREWFHIHLPSAVIWGYPWGREGQFEFNEGTWFNIRAFALPDTNYGNNQYGVDYYDSAFIIRTGIPLPQLPPPHRPFQVFTAATGGRFWGDVQQSSQLGAITQDILAAHSAGNTIDLAFVIDTTLSMKVHLDYIKDELLTNLMQQVQAANPSRTLRLAIVRYRDYPPAQYLTRTAAFSTDLASHNAFIRAIIAGGGGDIPEAVYEGLQAALQLDWQSDERIIIQIGDAPPHPTPRGRGEQWVDGQMVIDLANQKNIKLYAIYMQDPRRVGR